MIYMCVCVCVLTVSSVRESGAADGILGRVMSVVDCGTAGGSLRGRVKYIGERCAAEGSLGRVMSVVGSATVAASTSTATWASLRLFLARRGCLSASSTSDDRRL